VGSTITTIEINCIVCPIGCLGKVTVENETVVDAVGFICKRGTGYAQEEIKGPKRVLTTTVRILNGVLSFLPVFSNKPLPKNLFCLPWIF